jgi:hypothetical protein
MLAAQLGAGPALRRVCAPVAVLSSGPLFGVGGGHTVPTTPLLLRPYTSSAPPRAVSTTPGALPLQPPAPQLGATVADPVAAALAAGSPLDAHARAVAALAAASPAARAALAAWDAAVDAGSPAAVHLLGGGGAPDGDVSASESSSAAVAEADASRATDVESAAAPPIAGPGQGRFRRLLAAIALPPDGIPGRQRRGDDPASASTAAPLPSPSPVRGVIDVELTELTRQLHDGCHWGALASLALARAAAAAEASGTALGGAPAADALAASTDAGAGPVFVYLSRKGQRKLSTVIRSLSSAAAYEAAREGGARGDSPATLRASLSAPPHPSSARAALDALLSALVSGATAPAHVTATGRGGNHRFGGRRPFVVMPLASDAGRALRVHALAGDVRSCHALFLRLLAAWWSQADAAAALADAASGPDGVAAGARDRVSSHYAARASGDAPSSYLPPPSSLAAAVACAPIPPPHRPTVAAFNLVAAALAARPSTAPLAWRVLAAAQAAPLALHATPRVALTAIGLYAAQGRPDRAYAVYETLTRGAAELGRDAGSAPGEPGDGDGGETDPPSDSPRRSQPPPELQAELAAFLLSQRPYLAPLLTGGDTTVAEDAASDADGSDAESGGSVAAAVDGSSGRASQRPSLWQRLTRGSRAQRTRPDAVATGSGSSVHMILATVRPDPVVDAAWPPAAAPSSGATAEGDAADLRPLLTAPEASLLPRMPACPPPCVAFPLPLLLVSTAAPADHADADAAQAPPPRGDAAASEAPPSRAESPSHATVAGDADGGNGADTSQLLRWDGGSGVQAGRLHPALYSAALSALAGAPLLALPPQRGSPGSKPATLSQSPPPPFSSPRWVFPRVSRVLGDLRAAGNALDAVTATSLAGLCAAQGRPDAAVDVVASLEATAAASNAVMDATAPASPVDTRLLTAVLQAYVYAASSSQPGAAPVAVSAGASPSPAALRAAMVAQRLLALAGWRLQSQPRLSAASSDAEPPSAAQAQLRLLAELAAPGAAPPSPLAPVLRAPPLPPPTPGDADAVRSALLLPPAAPFAASATQLGAFRLDRTACSVLIAAFACAGHVPQVLALTEAALSLPREGAPSTSAVARARAASASAAAARSAGDDGSGGAAALPRPARDTADASTSATIDAVAARAATGTPAVAAAGGMAAGDVVVVSQALATLTAAGLGRHAVDLARSLLGDALTAAAAAATARGRFNDAVAANDDGGGALPPDAAAALYRSYAHARSLGRLHLDAGLYTAVMRACGSASAGPPSDALGLALSVHAAAVAANRAAYGWLGDGATAGDDGAAPSSAGSPRARRLQPVVFSEGTFSALLSVVASAAHTAALLPAAFPQSAPRGWERAAVRIAAETRRGPRAGADGLLHTTNNAASHNSQQLLSTATPDGVSSSGVPVTARHSPPPSPLPATPPVALTGSLSHLGSALLRQMLSLGLAPGEATFAALLGVLLAHEAAVCAAAAGAAREAGADVVAFPGVDAGGHAVTAPWLYALPVPADGKAPHPPLSSQQQAAARAATPLRRLLGTLGGRRLRLGRSPAVAGQVAVHVGTQAGGARKLWAARDAPALARALLAPAAAVAPVATRLQPGAASAPAAVPPPMTMTAPGPAANDGEEDTSTDAAVQSASPDRLHRYLLRLRGRLGDDARHLAASLRLHDGPDGGGGMRRRLASALWAHIEAEEAHTQAVGVGTPQSTRTTPLLQRRPLPTGVDTARAGASRAPPSLALAAVAARSTPAGAAPRASPQLTHVL